jgi:hypothetical protein
MVKLSHHLHLD